MVFLEWIMKNGDEKWEDIWETYGNGDEKC